VTRRGRIGGRVGVAAGAIALGVGSAIIARRHPDLSLAGSSDWATAAQLAAGWGLVAAGSAYAARRPASGSGALLVAAGFAWFVVEANNPWVGSSLAFTVGLLLSAACAPLIAHAALSHLYDRLPALVDVTVVAIGYFASVGVLGLLHGALFDPVDQGCLDCPRNLAHIGGSAGVSRAVAHGGLVLLLIWAIVTIALLTRQLAHASDARRRLGVAVLVPAAAYLALVAADAAHGLHRGFQSNDPIDRRLWVGQAVALVALAAGTTWERVRSRRVRAQLAHLVLTMGSATPSGGLRDALAAALDEPGLVLVYRSRDDEGWIDDSGNSVEMPDTPAVTQLSTRGEVVAAIGHRPGALGDTRLVGEVAQAARSVLEQERLQAELRARLSELRSSRARIVSTGDDERRRLERDLHDGAQQRLVSLALALRLARRQMARHDPALDPELAAAEDDLRRAIADLREAASGVHPVMLDSGGLAAALGALAEGAPRLVLGELPCAGAPRTVESAAYHIVRDLLQRTPEGRVAMRGCLRDGQLCLELESQAAPDALVHLEDRVGAVDGCIALERCGNVTTVRVELPCGS
jgi:signal transduction histidine kinase